MIFKRIRDLTVATIYDGLDQIENPIVMLNQYLRDMEKEITSAEKAITKQMTIKASFEKQKSEAVELVFKRVQQAELALKAGEEQLAKKALLSKNQYEEKVNYYEEVCVQNEEKISELKDQLHEMREKYQEMKDKKVVLIARANAAKTQRSMDVAMDRFDHEKAQAGFQRIEQKIFEMETTNHLNKGKRDVLLTSETSELEYNEAVEQEFNKLKEKISTQAPV
ncbi:PspA/IM30 family protein [Alkalihalobacterium elongatum]|uniref:PspA/IM30 family protein n=1 Tax=Alkalihalobacterium elongatum TaxID=2675466 RepID=UPI001C1F1FC7|nr:PspA/IM30 family protein [Alkalihalobacterium elongatum]